MANILVGTGTVEGHMYPALQIVKRLVTNGHDILWWSGEMNKSKIEKIGASFAQMPEYWDDKGVPYYEFRPEVAELKGMKQIKFYIETEFLGYCDETLEFYETIKDKFPIDLVLVDAITWPLYFLAEKLDVPCVNMQVIPLLINSKDTAPFGLGLLPGTTMLTKLRDRFLTWLTNEILFKDMLDLVNKKRKLFGLEAFDKKHRFITNGIFSIPDRNLYMTIPSFEYSRTDLPNSLEYIGPVLRQKDTEYVEPNWWGELEGNKPVILVNQGTMISDPTDLILPTIEALKNEDCLLIAVPISNYLGELPQNVRAAEFIPFGNLLPFVDVFITNAGYGGTHMALAEGIPIIAAGEQDDKMEIAARIEWSGCGINLRSKSPKPEKINRAVKKILKDQSYKLNAGKIQQEILKYDPIQLLADAVQEELNKTNKQVTISRNPI